MIYVVYVLHVIICLFLILVVLLQQGKGADLSVFGGGTTQTAFGARGAATLLHKLTVGFFILFIVTTSRSACSSAAAAPLRSCRESRPPRNSPRHLRRRRRRPRNRPRPQAPAPAPLPRPTRRLRRRTLAAPDAPAAPAESGTQPSGDAQPQSN